MPKAVEQLKSKWAIHVRTWMAANPSVTYKEALKLAKDSYKPARAAKVKTPPKPKEVKPKPAPKPKTERKTEHLQKWNIHVAEHRAQKPEISLKQALQEAKATYHQQPIPKAVPPRIKADIRAEEKKAREESERLLAEHEANLKRRRFEGRGRDKMAEVKEPVVEIVEVKEKPLIGLVQAEPAPKVVADVPRKPMKCGCGRRSCRCESRRCRDECCNF